ncbi:J domain-containing protein [Lysobacter terrae]
MHRFWFFERLGIAPTHDPGEIRRAYAIALKRLDQATQREAFEQLREAYLWAMDWARDIEEDCADEDVDESEVPDPGPSVTPPQVDDQNLDPAPASSSIDPMVVVYGQVPSASPSSAGMASVVDHEFERRQRTAAVNYWFGRLQDLDPGEDPKTLLDAAFANEHLQHPEAEVRLQAVLAHFMHARGGCAVLFEACAERFEWSRVIPLAIEGEVHDWIERVLRQREQWHRQAESTRRKEWNVILAARQEKPERWRAYALWPVLNRMQKRSPDWLAMQIAPSLAERWRRCTLNVSILDMPRASWLYFSHTPLSGKIFIIVLVLGSMAGLTARIMGVVRLPQTVEQPAPPTERKEEPLAFELTGPITADSCDIAVQFAHDSNWREQTDESPTLLITRILACHRKGLWPRDDRPFVDCLRNERIAALQRDRAENPQACSDAAVDAVTRAQVDAPASTASTDSATAPNRRIVKPLFRE